MRKLKSKFIALILIIAALITAALPSCVGYEENRLINLLLAGGGNSWYEFEYKADLKVNLWSLTLLGQGAVPMEVTVKGVTAPRHLTFYADVTISGSGASMSTRVVARDGYIYYQLDDCAAVVLGLLNAVGFIGDEKYAVMCKSLPLYEDVYIRDSAAREGFPEFYMIGEFGPLLQYVTGPSSLTLNRIQAAEMPPAPENYVDFDQVRDGYMKELHRTAGWRPIYLDMLLYKDGGSSLLSIATIHEDGSWSVSEPYALHYDVDGVDMEDLFGEYILPLRFVAELCGFEVYWDPETMLASILGPAGEVIPMPGALIGERTYNTMMDWMEAGFHMASYYDGEYIGITTSIKWGK